MLGLGNFEGVRLRDACTEGTWRPGERTEYAGQQAKCTHDFILRMDLGRWDDLIVVCVILIVNDGVR
jgi:hypothetical protein